MQAETEGDTARLSTANHKRQSRRQGFTLLLVFLVLIGGMAWLFRQQAHSTNYGFHEYTSAQQLVR